MMSFLKPIFGGSDRPNPIEALTLVNEGRAILIDVREADELRATGRAKGAIHLPLSTIDRTSDPRSGHFERKLQPALKGDMPVFVYCASGARSGRAAGVLRANGFKTVQNLGSLRDWQAAGGAIER